ncbi:diaminopropionate ammonia-lyase [Gordonia sp. zg691]|uniref:diaminopropionate ammonia-lyase n=1 Tax=Gordonia jinghuaiqii TaxID=2758710 RepID=UPI0016626369|nr:diaminopropionate ammonia-lyase [Gordonia jinghuaiqii]MBD0861933.1 diaminopropionate ammonia-lyase [Gordonia jinghuaiqii]
MTAASQAIVNDTHDPTAVEPLEGAAVRDFHRGLPGYEPTPLLDLPMIAERLGAARVSVKDESSRLGLPAFKILGASWAVAREVDRRLGGAGMRTVDELREAVAAQTVSLSRLTTLVAATDGNHGRAVARMAALLGLSAIILVPRDMVPARIDAIASEGAEVIVHDGDYDETVRRAATMDSDTHAVIADTAWPGYDEVPRWVVEGYATIANEVLEQLSAQNIPAPTVVVVQVGVGSFAASMVRSFAPTGARMIASEPVSADCLAPSIAAGTPTHSSGTIDSIMAGLNCGEISPIAWPTLQAGVQSAVTVTDDDARDAMRLFARAGVESGESGAAGLAALLAQPGLVRSDDHVLLISTEGITDPVAYAEIVGAIRAEVSA